MVVLIAALLILGPQKLPGAARQVGQAFSEFKRMASGFQSDVKQAFSEDTAPPAYKPPAVQTPPPPPTELPVPPVTPPDDSSSN